MAIENSRYQHAVGQGFFHTAVLHGDDELRLSYVYDCGAMERYATERKREIRKYLQRVGARSSLDLLFMSHVHADHLNGLEQLLDDTRGLDVDTVVLPLVNVADRLIAFARTVAEDRASAESRFYRDFVIDPGDALERFRPRRIIYVEQGNRDDGAPDGAERPLDPPDGPKVSGEGRGRRDPAWRLVGRGSVRPFIGPQRAGAGNSALRLVIPDTLAIMLSAAKGEWLLAPFVDPTVAAHRKQFLRELAKQCHVSLSKIGAWLEVSDNVEKLVTTNLDQLAAAYGALVGNLNITSLCLYSGPARGSSLYLTRHHEGEFGCVSHCTGPQGPIGWLATGDAALKEKRRRADFAIHYGELMKEVVTLTLPHHGSDGNFDIDLLGKVGPRICIAAADRYSTWKHPGAHTVQAVCSHPALLHVVTSKAPSLVFERARLG
ncbi:hypothetical protein [Mesorhizobium sp. ISC15]|uniref:hypothetical protein n=1 Tax=Mesorhizobium sp. ISC15 TaxID=3076429 RepID=UPI00301DF8C1